MIDVKIKSGTEFLDWEIVDKLFQDTTLGSRPSEKFRESCKYSPVVISAWIEEEIVGFGRAFTDYMMYASIYDVAVKNKFQGQGIGKRIMKEILNTVRNCNYITLFVAPGKMEFYTKLGFKPLKSGMIFIKDESFENVLTKRGHL